MLTDPLIDTLFAGRFRVHDLLGSGGMGSVYLATHEVLQRQFAIKLLHRNLITDRELAASFRREARAASRVDHPNVTSVFDFGHTEDGRPYLVMEYVSGSTLTHAIEASGSLSLPRALHILEQIAEALGAAHARGVVHRDLKPQNVLLTSYRGQSDLVKILDFGLARLLNLGAEAEADRGDSGPIDGQDFSGPLGTPDYMSPEHCQGDDVDERSDIYSFGVLAFELLVGRVPFHGTIWQRIAAHVEEVPPLASVASRRSDIPDSIDKLVARCLAKDPASRYPQAAALSAALGAIRRQLGDSIVRQRRSRAFTDEISARAAGDLGAGPTLLDAPGFGGLDPDGWDDHTGGWSSQGDSTHEWKLPTQGNPGTRSYDIEELASAMRDRGLGTRALSRTLARKIMIEDGYYQTEARVTLLNSEIAELEGVARRRESRLRQALIRLEHELADIRAAPGADLSPDQVADAERAREEIERDVARVMSKLSKVTRRSEARETILREKLETCCEYLEEQRRVLEAEESALGSQIECCEAAIRAAGDEQLEALFDRLFSGHNFTDQHEVIVAVAEVTPHPAQLERDARPPADHGDGRPQ